MSANIEGVSVEDMMKRMGEMKPDISTDSKYTVMYEGKAVARINSRLVEKQGIDDVAVAKIIMLHQLKYGILESATAAIEDRNLLRMYAKMVELLEFELQRVWKFPLDAKFHRFWKFPGCTCPRLDNEDSYGTSYSIVNLDCPVHGNTNEG